MHSCSGAPCPGSTITAHGVAGELTAHWSSSQYKLGPRASRLCETCKRWKGKIWQSLAQQQDLSAWDVTGYGLNTTKSSGTMDEIKQPPGMKMAWSESYKTRDRREKNTSIVQDQYNLGHLQPCLTHLKFCRLQCFLFKPEQLHPKVFPVKTRTV